MAPRKQPFRPTLTAAVLFGACLSLAAQSPEAPTTTAAHSPTGFTIDAHFNEPVWAQAPSQRIPLLDGDYAEFRVAYDENHLAFAVYVYDTDIRNDNWDPDKKWETWVDDTVEIYLDTKGTRAKTPQADDFYLHMDTTPQYDIRGMPDNIWTDQGDGEKWVGVYDPPWQVFMPNVRRAFRILGGRPNDPTVRDQGYVWEVSIPWSILPVQPSETEPLRMGLLVAIGDRDSDGRKIDHWEGWPELARDGLPYGAWKSNPSSWGWLVIPPLSQARIASAAAATPPPVQPTPSPAVPDAPAVAWRSVDPNAPDFGLEGQNTPALVYFRTSQAPRCLEVEQDALLHPRFNAAVAAGGLECLFVDLTHAPASSLAQRYGLFQVPTILVLGRNGHIQLRYDGAFTLDDLVADLGKIR